MIPKVTIIIVLYNGADCIDKLCRSIVKQDFSLGYEVVIVDNHSTDGGADKARQICKKTGWRFLTTHNIGFGAAANIVSFFARGEYLLVLNADCWLESDCLRALWAKAECSGAAIVSPLVRNYRTHEFQANGIAAFDAMAMNINGKQGKEHKELWAGLAMSLINKAAFHTVGCYDRTFFLYGEELDLSWRMRIAGYHVTHASNAVLHHRSPTERPFGLDCERRYLANRNHLLTLAKNAQGLLLGCLLVALPVFAAEGLAGALYTRSWRYFWASLVRPVMHCLRNLSYIRAQRAKLKQIRARGDLEMLKFFKPWRFGRWAIWKLALQGAIQRLR